MQTPAILDVATLSPGTCMICGCNSGPMVDTFVQLDPYGRMYICLDRCIPVLAELCGYSKVLAKVTPWLGVVPTSTLRCNRTKKNGEPCQGAPIPGRDYCVAHAHIVEPEGDLCPTA